MAPSCWDDYEKGPILGQGTFGSVFRAVHKKTGRAVAIKMVNVADPREGVSTVALREIKFLKEIHSPHVVELLDVFEHKSQLALVFDLMESDLEAVIQDQTIVLSPADIKSYMRMILQALATCHQHWVVHRDVKPNNMLLAATGELKLGDFGLARQISSPEPRYTNQVFVRWYRAPELLFGANLYTFAVDMWAVGCVFAELLLRRPWLPGNSDIEQLGKIFQALGTPCDASWPGCRDLPNFLNFEARVAKPLRQHFPRASEDALDLLGALLQLDPSKRPTAEEALAHHYFTNSPAPTPPHQLPKPQSREEKPLAAPNGAAAAGVFDDSSSEELVGRSSGGLAGMTGGAKRAVLSSDSEESGARLGGRQVRRKLVVDDD